jgi:hypothetical protein
MQPTAKGDLKDTEERKHIANKQRNIIGWTEITGIK